MPGRRLQHVAEVAEGMGADRLAFIGAGHGSDDLLAPGHGEMVGPELHPALDEGGVALGLGAEQRGGLLADRGLQHLAGRLRRAGIALLHGLTGGEKPRGVIRSEEHTSELQSLMRISYAVFCLKKKKQLTYYITVY